jgi:beta-lactam-binding protein with PASTA domain
VPPTPNPTPTPTPTATRCRVPKLAGKTLKVAKKALGKAHCALGKVKKKPSARKMRGKVIGQSPKAGASKARGTKVALVLGK